MNKQHRSKQVSAIEIVCDTLILPTYYSLFSVLLYFSHISYLALEFHPFLDINSYILFKKQSIHNTTHLYWMPFNSPRAMLAVSNLYVSCKRINAIAAPFKSSSDGNFMKLRCIVTFSKNSK